VIPNANRWPSRQQPASIVGSPWRQLVVRSSHSSVRSNVDQRIRGEGCGECSAPWWLLLWCCCCWGWNGQFTFCVTLFHKNQWVLCLSFFARACFLDTKSSVNFHAFRRGPVERTTNKAVTPPPGRPVCRLFFGNVTQKVGSPRFTHVPYDPTVMSVRVSR
jgi:hypothetical protein